MFSDDFDDEIRKERGLEFFARNDNFFRSQISLGEYESLPRAKFTQFFGEESYAHYVSFYPSVLFIDLGDVAKFLKIKNEPGFEAINIEYIADAVCSFIGLDSAIHEVLWNTFDEDVSAEVQARLGVDELSSHMTEPFNTAMGIIAEISGILQCYLINSRYPLVEEKSIYTVESERGGLLALRIRTYKELEEDYG